jgi:hypothetical protein
LFRICCSRRIFSLRALNSNKPSLILI